MPLSLSDTEQDIRRVRVDEIIIGKGFRKLDPKMVSSVAKSILLVGQMNPITVTCEPTLRKPKYHLVSGRIRLAAHIEAGWEFIDVSVVKPDAEMNFKRRITENLHRSDLTPVERGKLVKEWMELCGGEGGQVGPRQPNEKGVKRTAKALNTSPQSVRRDIKAAKVTPEALKALEAAGLHKKQSVVLEVAEEKPEDQLPKVKEIVRKREKKKVTPKPPKKTAKPTVSKDDGDDWSDTSFDQLKEAWEDSPELQKAWEEASAGDRKRFIDEVLLVIDDAAADNDNDNDNDNEASDDAA